MAATEDGQWGGRPGRARASVAVDDRLAPPAGLPAAGSAPHATHPDGRSAPPETATAADRHGLQPLAAWWGWLVTAAVMLALGWLPTLATAEGLGTTVAAALGTTGAAAIIGLGAASTRRHAELTRAVTRAERARAVAEAARAAAEEETKASHNQLQNLIDNTSSNIYMKRVDNGQYLLVNREWERLFGVTRDVVINLTDQEVFPKDLADQLRANDLGVARAGKTVQYEETAEAAGEVRTFLSVKFPVLDSHHQIYAVAGISTDITELKQAEAEARRLNAELETRVRERTAELEASTRELDAFAYSVSHDLRAPLRSLYGFAQAFIEDYDEVIDDTGRDYLNRLQRNVERMGQMIDDLLNLSRATRVELVRTRIDLTAMAREILAELAAIEPNRRVEWTVQEGLSTYGDGHLVRLALHNMLANAWKFTAKREVATLTVGQTTHAGEQMFFVQDNGAGFDMKYADKLFHAFQRLHPAADFEGSGIGLAIVARIMRRHGGQLLAEGEVDKGATFFFNLTPRHEGGDR